MDLGEPKPIPESTDWGLLPMLDMGGTLTTLFDCNVVTAPPDEPETRRCVEPTVVTLDVVEVTDETGVVAVIRVGEEVLDSMSTLVGWGGMVVTVAGA